ncbi:hypothetical protein [Streptacidiphilus sp. EB103A]|uniref:hypothetical protein n=1 Tax=Streptacidiphilus sp. EB103A TaxID=3156275 RepID=UPI003511FE9F
MSNSVTVDQQDSMLHGAKGTVAWSVGGERRTATLRVVRRDSADLPRPTDLLTFSQASVSPSGPPSQIAERRRGKRSSARTRTHAAREAA